jgi:hypothetical protein
MSASCRPVSNQNDKDYHEVMSASKKQTLPGLIRDIGRQYLMAHPRGLMSITKNLFNNNQDTADKMAAYKPDESTSMKAHEVFLLNRYLELPNYSGTLAEKIRALYKSCYSQEITLALLIRKISTETLQEIGRDYLKAHPTPTSWFSLYKHNNQGPAASLRDCHIVYNDSNEIMIASQPMDLWNCLLSVYKLLPNNSGEIACKIENKITNVFKIPFVKMDTIDGQSRKLTNSEIAERARPLMVDKIDAAYKQVEMETKNDNTNGYSYSS